MPEKDVIEITTFEFNLLRKASTELLTSLEDYPGLCNCTIAIYAEGAFKDHCAFHALAGLVEYIEERIPKQKPQPNDD